MQILDRTSKFLTAAAILTVAACGVSEDGAAPTPSPEAAAPTQQEIDQGRSVFAGAGNCGVCHGANAQGGRFGPDLTDGTWIWLDPDSPTLWNDITEVIRSGVADPEVFSAPMPAAGGANLSDNQIRAVAAYLLSLN